MPVYCYLCEACGSPTEIFRASAAAGAPRGVQCERCGKHATRDYQREVGVRSHAEMGELVSVAAGVMPEQAHEANRQAAALGLDVRFNHNGDAVFKNRHAKLKALKHMRLHDKDEVRG